MKEEGLFTPFDWKCYDKTLNWLVSYQTSCLVIHPWVKRGDKKVMKTMMFNIEWCRDDGGFWHPSFAYKKAIYFKQCSIQLMGCCFTDWAHFWGFMLVKLLYHCKRHLRGTLLEHQLWIWKVGGSSPDACVRYWATDILLFAQLFISYTFSFGVYEGSFWRFYNALTPPWTFAIKINLKKVLVMKWLGYTKAK